MGWNGTTLSKPFTKIAANGSGDLQRALGSSLMSQIRLFTEAYINPMAKYKGFRDPTVAFASDAARNQARKSARYGMSIPAMFVPNTSSPFVLPPAWAYERPRQGQTGEPLRALDFDGYYPYAIPPIYLECSQLTIRGGSGVWVWKDQSCDHMYPSTGIYHWKEDNNLSVTDLLGTSYNNMYIALVLYRYNSAGTAIEATTLITTGTKFGDISSSGNPGIFRLEAYETYDSTTSTTYPAIPELQNLNYDGRKYIVAACLCNTGPSSGKPYEVLPSNYSCFSLGFDSGRRTDYAEIRAKAASSVNELTGTFLSGPAITYVGAVGDWRQYRLNLSAAAYYVKCNIKTGSTAPSSQTLFNIEAVMSCSGSLKAPPDQAGAIGAQKFVLAGVSFTSPNTTYPKDLITYNSQGYDPSDSSQTLMAVQDFFIYKDAPKTVTITGKITYSAAGATGEQAFTNTLEITA